jgi:ABC-type sugar transport system permease subunit
MSGRPRQRPLQWRRDEQRLAWGLSLPAIAIVGSIAAFPIAWTFWESLHVHDLRMPWLGRPFVGMANYVEAFNDVRLRGAVAHTLLFAAATVTLELAGGLALALALNSVVRARGISARPCPALGYSHCRRRADLALHLRESSGLRPALQRMRRQRADGSRARAAWLPLILADVWKMTPFVAILLLAGLQNIDPTLYEAADVDGAGPWRRFTGITLPLLRPAITVAFLFRSLDALRVFDLVYVMTGGGPGSATEPIALFTFTALLQNLRFGFASAISVLRFLAAFAFAMGVIRFLGGDAFLERRI